jgi:hypothetical protein
MAVWPIANADVCGPGDEPARPAGILADAGGQQRTIAVS